MLACTWILPVIFCKDIKSSDRILSGSHIMNQDQNIGPGRALKYDSAVRANANEKEVEIKSL